MFVQSPNRRGDIAEAAIAFEATKHGFDVFAPLSDHSRADLIFGLDGELFRVQCKSANRIGEVVIINLIRSWHGPQGYVRNRYLKAELDLVAAYSAELDTSYLIPFEHLAGMSSIQLRLSPPRNGQRASIHYASSHEFSGAVAQLAERVAGSDEARGSNPLSSTPQADDATSTTVGAHEFRNHFGYYMERAETGEEIAVTRRGKPIVRLIAHQPELPVGSDEQGEIPQEELDTGD